MIISLKANLRASGRGKAADDMESAIEADAVRGKKSIGWSTSDSGDGVLNVYVDRGVPGGRHLAVRIPGWKTLPGYSAENPASATLMIVSPMQDEVDKRRRTKGKE